MKGHLTIYISFLLLLDLLSLSVACPLQGVAQEQLAGYDTLYQSQLDQVAMKNVKTIFSQKTLRMHEDSLLQNGLIDKVEETKVNALSGEDYIQKVHDLFSSQLEGMSGDKRQAVFDRPKRDTSLDIKETPRLSEYALSEKEAEALPYIHGYQLDTASIAVVKAQRIKGIGREVSKFEDIDNESRRNIQISPSQSLKERVYLEGVLGLSKSSDNGQVLYLSPALAFRFIGPLSFGVGPDIKMYLEKENHKGRSAAFGVRSFVKASFLENKIYAQFEDIIDNKVSPEENGSRLQHEFYAGGGCLVQLSPYLGVNFTLLHHVGENTEERLTIPQSPWRFRMGISILKITTNKR